MINSKIQVKLESFNYQLLNSSCNKLKKISRSYYNINQ